MSKLKTVPTYRKNAIWKAIKKLSDAGVDPWYVRETLVKEIIRSRKQTAVVKKLKKSWPKAFGLPEEEE